MDDACILISASTMSVADGIFKVTVTTLGLCTVIFGLSFSATVASGLYYHHTTESASPRHVIDVYLQTVILSIHVVQDKTGKGKKDT